ncbi:MAG: ATP-binding protein [Candidatus Aenigmatarchaeota archaeon]
MDRERIFEILSDWNFWFKDIDVGILRENYIKNLEQKFKSGEIIAVLGVRRSGKSTLLLQLARELIKSNIEKERILIVNFEDYRWEEYSLRLLEEIWNVYKERIWKGGKIFLFLDEIHNIPKWERFVRTLYDKNEANIFVSGSSSKLLSREYATLLSGRYLEFTVFPLSFTEFLSFRNFVVKNKLEIVAKKREVLRLLFEYMQLGGFPRVVLTKDEELLKSYFETIVVKDVAERYKIKEIEKLRKIAVFYLSNISNKITFNSLSKNLKISIHTVERFSYYLQEAFLLFFVNVFSPSLKTQEKLPKKVYSIDTGLSSIVGFRVSKDVGRFMENVAFLELKRRDKEVFYLKINDNEVDFVIKEGLNIKQLIQVTYASNKDEIEKREIKALIKASEILKCKDLLIITWDYEDEIKINSKTIKCIPLWKWLLET